LDKAVLRANRAGFPVALHGIGDLGVRMALNSFEKSNQQLHKTFANRIEHIEVVDPSDAPRFAALGVTASFQPSHMHFGSASSSYYPARLGPKRLDHSFAWHELESAGANIIFGSDYPVVDQDPIEGFHCAIHRTYYNGEPFTPHQAVSAVSTLKAYSHNIAKTVGESDELGNTAVGMKADFSIYKSNPLRGQSSLGSNPVIAVIVNGKISYRN
jgi:predicted amidohydrolase YtcJ